MPLLPNLPLTDHLPADAPVRTRILAAGVDLLLIEGFHSLTQQAVAKRAGVRQSHITYYFPARVDLLRHVAQFGCEQIFGAVLQKSVQGQVSPPEFREFLLPTEMDRGWFRLMAGMHAVCEEDPATLQWIDTFDRNIVTQFHQAFCMMFGEVPIETSKMLHACFVGTMMFDSREQSPDSLARARATMAHALDVAIASASKKTTRFPKSKS